MLAFSGLIKLLVPMDPWKFALDLQGIEISSALVTAVWIREKNEDWLHEGFPELVQESRNYVLQIEHEYSHLPSPVIKVSLGRISQLDTGYRLEFQVSQPTEDFFSFFEKFKTTGSP